MRALLAYSVRKSRLYIITEPMDRPAIHKVNCNGPGVFNSATAQPLAVRREAVARKL